VVRSEFFLVRMTEWEGEFQKYLNTTYPSLEGDDLLSELRSSVYSNLELCFLYANESKTSKYLRHLYNINFISASDITSLLVGFQGRTSGSHN